MQVSVEAALRRGHLMLKVVPLTIFVLSLMLSMVLIYLRMITPWGIAFAFIIGGVASWLWWSFAVTRWRIWSLTHVRNIHELMAYAVQDKLVWEKGSWLQHMEIRSRSQQEQLMQLEAKRATPDVIHNDPGVPPETVILFSRTQTGSVMIIGSLFICLCLFLLREPELEKWWAYALIGGLGLWMMFSGARKFFDRQPQLVLNDHGITLPDKGFFPWTGVGTAEVVTEGTGKNSRTLFKFRCANMSHELNIGELSISKSTLRHAIQVHRSRSRRTEHPPESA